MVKQTNDPMSFLSLLEASQNAVESSDKALIAAEEALTAAKIANNQAKEVLKAVTEAYVIESNKVDNVNETKVELRPALLSNSERQLKIVMDCESDECSDDMDDFLMLSTNKNPVNDVEDDSTEDEESANPTRFLLISSTGPAADRRSEMFGLYRLTEEIREGKCVYIQAHDSQCEDEDVDEDSPLQTVQ